MNLVPPVNKAVVVGNPVSMKCGPVSINFTVQWNFRDLNMSEGIGRTVRRVFIDGYSVQSTRRGSGVTFDLIINRTQPQHAGMYICIIDSEDPKDNKYMIYEAELAVLCNF